jgi:molecular chaperone HtpG
MDHGDVRDQPLSRRVLGRPRIQLVRRRIGQALLVLIYLHSYDRLAHSAITAADYTDFYRSVAGQFDEPGLTVHFRAGGRHEYSVLAFVPGTRPFDLLDPDRKGRIRLYVKRVFITDEAEILPRYLRFVRGLVDSADLPLNISREMIQQSPILTAIAKGLTNRLLGEGA